MDSIKDLTDLLDTELNLVLNSLSEYVSGEKFEEYSRCYNFFINCSNDVTFDELEEIRKSKCNKLFNSHLKACLTLIDYQRLLSSKYSSYLYYFNMKELPDTEAKIRFLNPTKIARYLIMFFNFNIDPDIYSNDMSIFVTHSRAKLDISELGYIEKMNNMIYLMYKNSGEEFRDYPY